MSTLANDFYLVAHDDRSGRCRIPARAAALGLAAGLLAELVLGEHVRVVAGRVVPGGAARPPQDRGLRDLAGQVVATCPADVGWWLGRTAPAAVELIRYRLVLDGLVTRASTRS